jgi:hypothetical protein
MFNRKDERELWYGTNLLLRLLSPEANQRFNDALARFIRLDPAKLKDVPPGTCLDDMALGIVRHAVDRGGYYDPDQKIAQWIARRLKKPRRRSAKGKSGKQVTR